MSCAEDAAGTGRGPFKRWRIGERLRHWRAARKADHPLADAQRLQKIIDSLPYHDPWQALEDVNHWLVSINDTPTFTPAQRYELVGKLDTATRCCQAQLLERYLTLRKERFVEDKRAWQTMTAFWSLLGAAYVTCARQCGVENNSDVSRALRAQIAVLTARGLRALRYEIKWLRLRYSAVRPDIWRDAGCFAALVDSCAGNARPVELYAGSKRLSSPHDELLRLMLFWVSSPDGLSPLEQDVAERLVVHLTPKFRLLSRHEDDCDFYFDITETQPPLPLVRSSPWSPSTRYMFVDEARQAVKSMHALVSSTGQLPAGLDLGPAADANGVARVLQHLLLNWAREMPPRAHERRKAAVALNVVQGYQDVLSLIAPGSVEEPAAQNLIAKESWLSDDVSAGGYGVIVPAGSGEALCVGRLVALRAGADAVWQVGVIRRMRVLADHQRHVGIQLLSKTAVPVHLRTMAGVARGGKRQWAILLSEAPAHDGTLQILARRDLLSGHDDIEARFGPDGNTVLLEPAGVVESSQDFDWLRFHLPAQD